MNKMCSVFLYLRIWVQRRNERLKTRNAKKLKSGRVSKKPPELKRERRGLWPRIGRRNLEYVSIWFNWSQILIFYHLMKKAIIEEKSGRRIETGTGEEGWGATKNYLSENRTEKANGRRQWGYDWKQSLLELSLTSLTFLEWFWLHYIISWLKWVKPFWLHLISLRILLLFYFENDWHFAYSEE